MNLSGPSNKKDLNVELNLLPVFDVLSVCICFLLMTVVWVEVKSLETKQVMGGSSAEAPMKKTSLWLTVDSQSNLVLTMKPAGGAKEQSHLIIQKGGQIDWQRATDFLRTSSDKIEIAQILPSKTTRYDQVIKLMDLLKQNGIKDIGLSPI